MLHLTPFHFLFDYINKIEKENEHEIISACQNFLINFQYTSICHELTHVAGCYGNMTYYPAESIVESFRRYIDLLSNIIQVNVEIPIEKQKELLQKWLEKED